MDNIRRSFKYSYHTNYTGCEYTSYQQNVGMFSDANKMNQRQLRSDEACKEWCDQYPGCRAAVISPSYWAYRECFLVSTSTITSRYGWKTALKNGCNQGKLKS